MANDNLPSEVSDEQVKLIMQRVLQAEKEKIHMKRPRGINDDIEAIVQEEVD